MAVTVEMQNTGDSAAHADVIAIIEHVLGDRRGDWRVLIVGSRANDNWVLKIEGPAGFERSYTVDGGAGEHSPQAIGRLLHQLLPPGR